MSHFFNFFFPAVKPCVPNLLFVNVMFCWVQVAKVVADTMNNYLLFEHLLQVHLVPPERIHPKL